jgi:cobyrinic acid a,c-diamide synthase
VHRIVIAGLESGVGKTTVVVGLVAALKARGLSVVTFKCGPDYLDPIWHARASGRPSHALDGWMMGQEAVLATFSRATGDVAIIEGMMGLYDGASPVSDEGSAAEIARWLSAPVVAVVDAWAMARTIGAVGLGLEAFDRRLDFRGLVANRVGGRAHLDLMIQSYHRVLGGLPRRDELAIPERHLGLHQAGDDALEKVRAWGGLLEEWGLVDPLLQIARSAPPMKRPHPAPTPAPGATNCRIGVARDAAFHFYYEDNLTRLSSLGAELIFFSPIADRLPDVDAVYLGGGYPELHAEALSRNGAMRAALARFSGPIYAECGGLMYLCRAIRTLDGRAHEMVGRVDAVAAMTPSLQALGYVEVETLEPTLFGPPGVRWRGHQFRHCRLESAPPGGALRVRDERQGWGGDRVLASWVHAHWASCPEAAASFVRSAAP